MAPLQSPSRDRAAAIVLFCALCGVLLGLGMRMLRQRAAGPGPQVARVAVPADLGLAGVAERRLTGGPVDAGRDGAGGAAPGVAGDSGATAGAAAGGTAGRDAGAGPGGRTLWVVVLDLRGQPVTGATVAARLELSPRELAAASSAALAARPPAKSATPSTQPIGELGVLSGPLPFPEDIITGSFQSQGVVQRGASVAGGLTALTDGKGVARLFPIPPGLVQLQVNQDNKSAAAEVVVAPLPPDAPPESAATALHLVLRLGAQPDALCTLPGESGEPLDPAPAASEGPEVAGRVEDGRGFAVSGARLELTSGRVRTQTISDPRGAFAVRGLPAGGLTVVVRHQGFAPLTLTQAADKPRHELRLTLHPGGGVDGLVRDGRAGGVPPGTQLFVEGDGGFRQAVGLAADGHFVATGLVPGELVLRARAPGYAPLSVTVKVPAGETPAQVTAHDVRLELQRSATLRGRVRGPDGVAAGVAVTLTPVGQERLTSQVLTDARGEFVATDLPPGKLRLRAVSGSTSATAELEVGAGDTQHTELELH